MQCPECFSRMKRENGELVCTECYSVMEYHEDRVVREVEEDPQRGKTYRSSNSTTFIPEESEKNVGKFFRLKKHEERENMREKRVIKRLHRLHSRCSEFLGFADHVFRKAKKQAYDILEEKEEPISHIDAMNGAIYVHSLRSEGIPVSPRDIVDYTIADLKDIYRELRRFSACDYTAEDLVRIRCSSPRVKKHIKKEAIDMLKNGDVGYDMSPSIRAAAAVWRANLQNGQELKKAKVADIFSCGESSFTRYS